MNGADFYSELMQGYVRKIAALNKDKLIYDKVIPILESLLSGLPDIKTNLVDAESYCSAGGFISDGEPYGQGRFNDCYTKLGNDISTIESVLADLRTRQQSLISSIETYKSYLETARSKYISALNNEKTKTE